MKLRIYGNSIRLRLLRGEVSKLHELGEVAAAVRFGPEPTDKLVYCIKSASDASEVSTIFRAGQLTVHIPVEMLQNWALSDQISIHAEQSVSDVQTLSILIEKDFKCLHRATAHEDADAFPHPLAG